jgi:hypothetical protein
LVRRTQLNVTRKIRFHRRFFRPSLTKTLERDGWTSKVEWRDGELTIEHERAADGAHVSERYWVVARADELHWTARLKRAKGETVDVKRVFYRAPADQDTKLPLTAQLSP